MELTSRYIVLQTVRNIRIDVDDLDAIRVPTEDKVEIIGEIGESSKEKVMEEGECVEELIHEVNDVASSNLKSGDEKHNGIDKELNKGVFGNADSEAKNDISSGVINEDAERGLNYGIPNPFIDCSSDNHKTASNEAHNSNPNMKSYANKLSDGLNSNDNEFFLLGYARVLIEINVEDEFSDNIEINYVDVINCVMKPKPKTTVHNQARPNAEKNIGASKEGFVEVTNIKNSYRRVWNKEHQGNKQQPIGVKVAYKPKEAADKSKEGTQERTKHQETRAEVNKSPKVWNVGKDNIEELRKSASKYAVLSDEENNIEVDPFLDKRLIVDEFIKKKLQPTCEETRDWNYDMINYFKIKWEAMERQDLECSDDDDVFEMNDQATQSFIANKIVGKAFGVAGGDNASCV
ncbi:hypothetical protein Tco_1538919 [Tanacetum coccineum]